MGCEGLPESILTKLKSHVSFNTDGGYNFIVSKGALPALRGRKSMFNLDGMALVIEVLILKGIYRAISSLFKAGQFGLLEDDPSAFIPTCSCPNLRSNPLSED